VRHPVDCKNVGRRNDRIAVRYKVASLVQVVELLYFSVAA